MWLIEIPLGDFQLQVSGTQVLGLFWSVVLTAAFNAGYFLSLRDRRPMITRPRVAMTVLIGTLCVLGTYAEALAGKGFTFRDCLFVALVAAHGWTADDFVQRVLRNVIEPQSFHKLKDAL